MKVFILSTLLIASLILLMVDLRIQRNALVRDRVMIQSQNHTLMERQSRIESEIQIELGSPALQDYILYKMQFHRDHKKSYLIAREMKHGTDDRQSADENNNRPSQP